MNSQDPLYLVVGDKIRQARKAKKMSQATLAKAVGVARVSITMYEIGRVGVPISNLYRIAAALECEVTDLIPPELPLPPKPAEERSDEFNKMLIQRLGGVR